MVGMSVNLLREAMNQQLRILKMPEYPDGPILDVKRKVTESIMIMAGVKESDKDKARQQNIFNIMGGNVINDGKSDNKNDMHIEATEEEMRQIEADIEEVNQLAMLHKAAKSKKDVKQITDKRGYSDEIATEIIIPGEV
jgi:hypothetical protein